MEHKELICINCPLGCTLNVTLQDGKVTHITGNTCPRGAAYAQKECPHPTRTLTTTIRVTGGRSPVTSVKTATDIPKEKITDCMEQIKKTAVSAPVHIGDILISNLADTGTDLIATKNNP